MPRSAAKVTQADVARVLRAVAQTDADLEVVIETDGRIRILPHSGNKVDSPAPEGPQPKSWN
ncbi:hypothetical protein [Thalassobius sp. I31.1]|uniref:hypothetical protein n=1 Tax=Thalassobius sp. I31.1 TaxID=2109912 RepID=UPI000D1B5728|nr:hypothetical protein [Thalassobius sp. I31.1]